MSMRSETENLFVAGYPELLARKCVERLLHDRPLDRIELLVQTAEVALARDYLERLPEEARQRVSLLEGDACAIDFGLSGAEYRSLASRAHRVYHLASALSPCEPQASSERKNVSAARELLAFSSAASALRAVVFLSSASVSGARTGTVLEGELEMGQSFRSYTEETLARAERMLRRLGAAQPYIVIRPAPVVGDSTSGEVDQLTGPYPYLAVILSAPSDVSMPLPTRGDERFSVVPVDYVAHAVSHLSRHPAAVGKTFHLVDPRAPTVRRALELVATHAGKRVPNAHIPGQVTKALLHTAGLSALGRDQRAYFDVVRTPVQYDTRNADELLESAGISCPPFESYAPALVRHLEERIRKSQAGNAPETSDA